MKTSSPAKPLGTPLDGILQEEAAANAHSGRPSGQNQNPAAQEMRAREASLDNATRDVELGEVDLDNATPGAELGEDPAVEKKRPASAGTAQTKKFSPHRQFTMQLAFDALGTSLDDMIEICETASIPYSILEV